MCNSSVLCSYEGKKRGGRSSNQNVINLLFVGKNVENDGKPFSVPSGPIAEPSAEFIAAQLATGDRQPRRVTRAGPAGDHRARRPVEGGYRQGPADSTKEASASGQLSRPGH